MNSAIANDFEAWFRAQLDTKPFLYSQHIFYDSCERIVAVDDGTDKNGSYMDLITQRAEAAAWGKSAKLEQIAGFRYNVPKQVQRSAF